MKHQSMRQLFIISIGNYSEFPIEIISSLGRSALDWRGVMSLKRPNPGGESCKAGFFFIPASTDQSGT